MLLSVRTKTTESKPVKLETIHVHCTVILALPMNSECALIPNIRGGWLAEWGYFKAICIRANRNIRNCLSIWVITSWTIGLLLLTLTYKSWYFCEKTKDTSMLGWPIMANHMNWIVADDSLASIFTGWRIFSIKWTDRKKVIFSEIVRCTNLNYSDWLKNVEQPIRMFKNKCIANLLFKFVHRIGSLLWPVWPVKIAKCL